MTLNELTQIIDTSQLLFDLAARGELPFEKVAATVGMLRDLTACPAEPTLQATQNVLAALDEAMEVTP